jgi:hypothetical protein
MSFVALGVIFPIKIALAGWLVLPQPDLQPLGQPILTPAVQEPAPAANPPRTRKPVAVFEWPEFPRLCESRPSWLRAALSNAEVIFLSPIAIRLPKGREVSPLKFRELSFPWWGSAGYISGLEMIPDAIDLLSPQPLRGSVPENLQLPLAVSPSRKDWDPASADWLRQPHLFFLWPDGDGWRSSKIAPNGIPMNVVDQAAYTEAIQSWESLIALEQGIDITFAPPWTPAKHAETVKAAMADWLMTLARNPTTRGYAGDELYPLRCHRTQHETGDVCVTVQDLTASQVDELIQILADCETPGPKEFKLYEALRDSSDDRLVEFLVQYISSIHLESKDQGVLGDLAYDVITRAANEEAMTLFRQCWTGGIGSLKFGSRIHLPHTAMEQIVSLIRSQLEC